MIVGDKIRLIREMGVFKNVGEICTIVDIAKGGVISFRFGGCHLGCMSYDEYLKYFEKVDDRHWTNWIDTTVRYCNLDNKTDYITVSWRHNAKRVQIKYSGLLAEACCHSEDTFDEKVGLELATKRLKIKLLKRQLDEYTARL